MGWCQLGDSALVSSSIKCVGAPNCYTTHIPFVAKYPIARNQNKEINMTVDCQTELSGPTKF